jgi:hypothetical protein
MKKLLLLVLLLPLVALAQKPLDGTWRTSMQGVQIVGNDSYSLANGVYHCHTCVPKYQVKADGKDHKVTGSPYFDTAAVRLVDYNTIEVVRKRGGKDFDTETRTVSPDGKTMTVASKSRLENGEYGTSKVAFTRVGAPPAGEHRTAGQWHIDKVEDASDSVLLVTYKATDDGLSMSDQGGASYSAKLDGKDYPMNGDPGATHVALKKVSDTTIDEIAKRNGKVVRIVHMTVSADGKTMTSKLDDKLTGKSYQWTSTKQ